MRGDIGLPAIIRPSLHPGRHGGGIAYNVEEFEALPDRLAMASPVSPTPMLIEESLLGWKEFELEVMRDLNDNVRHHLLDRERRSDGRAHRRLDHRGPGADPDRQGIPDACATPRCGAARDRASKPAARTSSSPSIPTDGRDDRDRDEPARVAGRRRWPPRPPASRSPRSRRKLAVGYTRSTRFPTTSPVRHARPASSRPSTTVVTKIPRFAFEKFPGTKAELGTQMKSVGEAMAMGRTFQESHAESAALPGNRPWTGSAGSRAIDGVRTRSIDERAVRDRLLWSQANPDLSERMILRSRYALVPARGSRSKSVADLDPGLDRWFLSQLDGSWSRTWQRRLAVAQGLSGYRPDGLLRQAKRRGLLRRTLAHLLGRHRRREVRDCAASPGRRPVFKRVDTCAAEFEASTPYMYSTYEAPSLMSEVECEAATDRCQEGRDPGWWTEPDRAGHRVRLLLCARRVSRSPRSGIETIMVNCNPETVSTDYDTSDRLYFEPLDARGRARNRGTVLEKPKGVIVQFGGQTPLQAGPGAAGGAAYRSWAPRPTRSTSPRIASASAPCSASSASRQPDNGTRDGAARRPRRWPSASAIPLLVRPSYVLGGRAMEIVLPPKSQLEDYDGSEAAMVSAPDQPGAARPLPGGRLRGDVDCARRRRHDVVIAGIMQHIERSGCPFGGLAPARCRLIALPNEIVEDDGCVDWPKRFATALWVVRGLMNVPIRGQEWRSLS